MKNFGFILLAFVVANLLASCAGDNGGCDLEGKWVIKDVKLASQKLDSTILNMSKTQLMSTTYSFTKDSITIAGNPISGNFVGTYKVEEGGAYLTWNAKNVNSEIEYVERIKILDCGGGQVELLQRSPTDTTKPEIATATLLLERSNK